MTQTKDPLAMAQRAAAGPPLSQPYLLLSLIGFCRDPDGQVWLDDLWWQDLCAHLDYLSDVTVLAPLREGRPPPGWVPVRLPATGRLKFVELYTEGTPWQVLAQLPRSVWRAWGQIGQAALVHSGVAGWPFPPSYYVNPLALLRGRPLILVVESAFWRLPADAARPGLKVRLRSALNEGFARWSLRKARLGIYTHEGYRQTLPTGPCGEGVVLPASWIRDEDVVSPDAAAQAWDAKPAVPRFLLASRLVGQKGIPLFLQALHQLEARGTAITVDVIGSGELRGDIARFAQTARHVRLRLLDPVPYGAPFLTLMRGYHATIVPLTGDEQPRILYDAFSQAVPAIASDTAGNRQVIGPGDAARMFRAGSATDLAQALTDLAADPGALRAMGQAALSVAQGATHAQMHARRAAVLRRLFGTGPTP